MSGRSEKALRRAAGRDLKVERARAIAERERVAAQLAEKYRAHKAARDGRMSAASVVAISAALAVT